MNSVIHFNSTFAISVILLELRYFLMSYKVSTNYIFGITVTLSFSYFEEIFVVKIKSKN